MCYETPPSFMFKTSLSSYIKIKYRPKRKSNCYIFLQIKMHKQTTHNKTYNQKSHYCVLIQQLK